MATKIIKHLLFTHYVEVPSLTHKGETVLKERISSLGDKVDVRDEDIQRGERLHAFYTNEEAAQIEKGTYKGADAEAVYAARQGVKPRQLIEPAEGEHGPIEAMDAATLGEYIRENRLNVRQTVALIPEDADLETLQKFEDAENVATDNEPRQGVLNVVDKQRADLEAD